MNIRRPLTTGFLRFTLGILCQIDKKEINKIPLTGPMIICFNHINFLEAPLMQVLLHPRSFIGVAKKESWKTPFLAYLVKTYKAIPIERGGTNLTAFTEIRSVLAQGHFLGIAPEGTRSGNGILQEGKAGVAFMALMTEAPIIPVAFYGSEAFWDNLKHLRRTRVTVKVGDPFYLDSQGKKGAIIRNEMTREIMLQMARLLPEHLRGVYSQGESEKSKYLRFVDSTDRKC